MIEKLLPEPQPNSEPMLIAVASAPILQNPMLVAVHHIVLRFSLILLFDLSFKISPTIMVVIAYEIIMFLLMLPLIIVWVINIPKTEIAIKINFVIVKFKLFFDK